jgi:Domain of unknown function (DUF1840)
MLVSFRSSATETITMFQDVAVSLLKLMGATGRIPGAFNADDVPAALQKLESAVEAMKAEAHATAAPAADNEDTASDDDQNAQPPVALATRAIPLLSLVKRAAAAHAEVVWEGKGK